MPVDVIQRNLDGMAAVKLNVFHWHLSDNQGFRVESKRIPSCRNWARTAYFYTQDEVREVIAYARDRGIRVLPEFDIPGHSTAWLAGYPELAAGPVRSHWPHLGHFRSRDGPHARDTYQFLDGFIGEMAKLFPDEYFHIGGDEVNGQGMGHEPAHHHFQAAHQMQRGRHPKQS